MVETLSRDPILKNFPVPLIEILPITETNLEIIEVLPITETKPEIIEILPKIENTLEIIEIHPIIETKLEIIEILHNRNLKQDIEIPHLIEILLAIIG